jgi:hypothetical protein
VPATHNLGNGMTPSLTVGLLPRVLSIDIRSLRDSQSYLCSHWFDGLRLPITQLYEGW